MRPTWAEVSLPALWHNYRAIVKQVSRKVSVMAVVKADAYGHGAVECARVLASAGAGWFGVTSIEEGVQLRGGGVKGRIIALSGFWPGEEAALIEHEITPAVWDARHLQLLGAAAGRRKTPKPLPVHLKIDTGMARLGATPRDLEALLRSFQPRAPLFLEGVLTHLASAEILDAPDCEAQITCFDSVLRRVTAAGFAPAWLHMANSAAIAVRPQTWKNMVRPGIALYGYALPLVSRSGDPPANAGDLGLKPVLTWKTRVLALRDVPAGQPVSYDATYVTRAPARIAVLPVGYADGFNRQLSSKGRVIVRNQFAPVIGKVTMDLTMIDVSGIDGVEVGDEVVLIGSAGEHSITAWEHATLASTIPYEILCNISKRVSRKYVD